MQFPPDVGFAIQIAAFLVLWWVLKRWLFDPTLRVLELRKQRTAGQLAEAERLRSEAAAMRAEYEAAIEKVKAGGREEIAAIRRESELEEARVLDAARAEAASTVDQVRSQIATEVETARATLTRHAAELSVEAVEKILGRPLR
jgi:F-type H+-transporting ATPase subunit b